MELELYAAIALQALIIGTLLKPILEEGSSKNRAQRWLRALELFGILCLGVSLFAFSMAMYISDFRDFGLILTLVLLPLGVIVMIISYCWSLKAN
ncbi:hypothetical protein PTT65_18720 [Serratia ureilytica]|uniref:hypothetical protein n=1 Tax=Serratia TaxID=613 RepID=UPI000C19590C|nr:hypothetical protein [Serratia sp. OPWLW2]PIJ41728.1 hypothetical protein BOM25_15730 [Serratia sp. OPWLW2]HDU8664439.1 hypothetical protein [Serratia liquefaciens]